MGETPAVKRGYVPGAVSMSTGVRVMASSVPSLVRRQVTRVGRRLFLQTLLDSLVWCWVAALALAAGWFLLQPYVLQANPEWLRWTVAGGLLGVGLMVAVVLAVIRAPSRLAA